MRKFAFEHNHLPSCRIAFELSETGEIVKPEFFIDPDDPLGDCDKRYAPIYTPSEKDWDELSALLAELGAPRWKRSYENRQTLDGIDWEFEYRDEDLRVESGGLNAFPAGYDRLYNFLDRWLDFDE